MAAHNAISEDQIAIDWTLTEDDNRFVRQHTRGIMQNIRFAAHLCYLRTYHRFIDATDILSITVINYLCKQLEGEPVSKVPSFTRKKQDYAYKKAIMGYLGYREFDEIEANRLEEKLVHCLRIKVLDKKQLMSEAHNHLKENQVVLPPEATLARIMGRLTLSAYQQFYQSIINTLPTTSLDAIDVLIKPATKGQTSIFNRFKRSPANANATVINEYLNDIDTLEALGFYQCTLAHVDPNVVRHLSTLGRYYNVNELQKISSRPKRLSIAICFLYEISQQSLDTVVALNNQILIDVKRRAKNEFVQSQNKLTARNKGKFKPAGDFIDNALSQGGSDKLLLKDFLAEYDQEALSASAQACKSLDQLNDSGIVNNIVKRFNYLRRYCKCFIQLKFEGKTALAELLEALSILKDHHNKTIKQLPDDVPTDFLPKMWRDAVRDEDDNIKPYFWEMGVYYAMKQKIDSGDLYLSKSLNNRYFWDTVIQGEMQDDMPAAQTSNTEDANHVLEKLLGEFHRVATLAQRNFPDNDFAYIEEGKLCLHREDALVISTKVKELKRLIESHLPTVRIEKLIADVAKLSEFNQTLSAFNKTERAINVPLKPISAAIIAHATNIGLYGMGSSAVGITTDMLRTASVNYLRPETLSDANKCLINYYLKLPISRHFGDGLWSSSDGQRFGIDPSSALSGYYPRFFGYYEQAISLYTHISKDSVFGTQVISCTERESTYVLTGLLQNKTLLEPKFHCTDSHGYTEHIFSLFYLLGFSFHPRLKDLTSQKVYKVDKETSYGDLDELFSGTINLALIRDNWDQIMRIIAALNNGLAPAHVIIRKLANRNDAVSKAIRALGRLIKSIYILRYISDKALRYKVHLHLNRGESRHQLVRVLFFANRGIFKTNNVIEIMNKASCLSLLSNAILVWNTYHIQLIVEKLRVEGYEILDEHLEKISPLMFKHIQIHGTYHFDDIFTELVRQVI